MPAQFIAGSASGARWWGRGGEGCRRPRWRLEREMSEKERIYGERYPIDEDFLAALAMMPQSCGIALGFDRLVMLATGASRIDHILWNPLP